MPTAFLRQVASNVMRRRVTVLLYPGSIFLEIAPLLEVLAPECDISFFTPDGTIHDASNGTRVVVNGSFAQAMDTPADCVVVPGGNPDSIIELGSANPCIAAAYGRGAVLAGICAGVLVIARSGLLHGKRATHNYTAEHTTAEVLACTDSILEGIVFERADIVVDQPFITAQHWAREKFAVTVAVSLGVFSPEQAEQFVQRQRYSYDDA
ncbi:DJ-1/PfpI family protein [Chitinimonas sp. JJ19]|uniref:DJ-1/PfpI family protein n=1 Tax=Chitinimonas sp. JJ19 TaxID=3109352 RepID=UPI00300243FD